MTEVSLANEELQLPFRMSREIRVNLDYLVLLVYQARLEFLVWSEKWE